VRTLVLFEDDRAARFEPVALTRSVAGLRSGLWTHRERWARLLPDRTLAVVCRGVLADCERASGDWASVNPERREGDVLFVAAALGRPAGATLAEIRDLPEGAGLVAGGRLVAARAEGGAAARIAGRLREIAGRGPFPEASFADWARLLEESKVRPRDARDPRIPATLVDLMAAASDAIRADFDELARSGPAPSPTAFPGAHFLEPARIRLGTGVRIDPGVVLDAREGPIVLGDRTRVMANTVIQGPVCSGPDCLFKPLTRAMDGVCLGPVCRVGGELDATIVQGFSNKQHDGFLGHSYVGSWVNLGAATDTSDLKNDYGFVRVTIAGEELDTGSRHVGSLVGDHSKTAIHTRLNTGTVIGVSANVFGAGFPPKEIPSFTWGGGAETHEYRLEKAVQVASIVTARRDVVFGAHGEALFAALHRATADRRAALFGAAKL
jgi:UDP-N-acetylglucosamine diphosphorylase/glucosamine-1-phosphate N-acetyltransferase